MVKQSSRFTRVELKDRQTDKLIFYKVETYLDRLLVPKIHVIPNFVKFIRAVLKIYESCVHGQTDNPIFYKIETHLGRLLVHEIHVIPRFVEVVRAVLLIYVSCVHGQTDRQMDFLQG